jgi:hypothetical protein
MSVVVPRLIIDGIKWKFMGEQTFKRSCLVRGLVPIRADPNKSHDHDATETELRSAPPTCGCPLCVCRAGGRQNPHRAAVVFATQPRVQPLAS